jgi:prepilin-type N-terminal cleavage/methylation domain-containing protein
VEQARIWQFAQHDAPPNRFGRSHILVSLAAIFRAPRAGWSGRGFSMVELLVTMVLAGIVFAAMVPFFVSAARASSGDRARTIATNVAQDRIEKMRMLSFDQLAASNAVANLESSTFAGGQFGSSYSPPGGTSVYPVQYAITPVPSTGAVNYVRVEVDVTTPAQLHPSYTAIMKTIVLNPSATSNSSSPSPSPSASPSPSPSPTVAYYKLTVIVTTSNVTSAGVTVVRTDVTPNVAASPASQIPTAATPVYWTSLFGGTSVTYLVACNYKPHNKVKTLSQTVTLSSDQTITFDTSK